MLVRSNAAALPGKAGLQGAVPHAQDPRPGLSARGLAGEGRAAGRGVHQDVAEQQAVEAAKHVHHTAGQQRRDVRRSEGFASAAFHKVSWEHNPTPARPPARVWTLRLGDSHRPDAGFKPQTDREDSSLPRLLLGIYV